MKASRTFFSWTSNINNNKQKNNENQNLENDFIDKLNWCVFSLLKRFWVIYSVFFFQFVYGELSSTGDRPNWDVSIETEKKRNS